MIVRRILKCGAEIGRYIEITKKTTKGYYGKTLRSSEEFFIAETLDNFKEIEVVAIKVGKVELEALKHAIHVYHELTPQWKKVLEKETRNNKSMESTRCCIYMASYDKETHLWTRS